LAERRINPLLNLIGKRIVRLADSVRVVSTTEGTKLVRLGVPSERIWNLGWIGDFDRFDAVDGQHLRSALLGDQYRYLVLFVGRLVKQKDLPTLLRGAAAVRKVRRDVRFLLAGSGSEASLVDRLIEELDLGDSVKRLGPVPYVDLPDYYAACDVVALPSHYEGNARVLAEAAAASKPVVTTDVSGARDTVQEGRTGFIIPVSRPDLLAERLLSLIEQPTLAHSMGQQARSRVRELYSDDRLLAGFKNLWTATASRASA
jgi:phosphatidylinositol alpha-1,6-mannosyltransferase